MINQDSWEWLAICPGGIKAMTSKWSSMFINHDPPSTYLHVFPIWIGCMHRACFQSSSHPGPASFARMEQSLAHFVSCICYHALQGAFGGIFVAKMTSVSFTVRGGFHSLKGQQIEDPFNFRWVGWIYIHDKAWYDLIMINCLWMKCMIWFLCVYFLNLFEIRKEILIFCS